MTGESQAVDWLAAVLARRLGRDATWIEDTQEKVKLIRQRLLTAQSRQKSYADNRRRDLEFEVGDRVFLKVLAKRGMIRQGKWDKLGPRYVGPF